jgi:hypothetical protein
MAPDYTSVATGAQARYGELTNEMGIIEPDPLMLTLYSNAMHDRDITDDPMLEEFAASLVGTRIIAWPSLEHLSSPAAPPSYRLRPRRWPPPQLEVEDPTVVSCELRTPPPHPI